MVRTGLQAAVAVALLMTLAVAVASAAPAQRGKNLTVVERATTDIVVDLGEPGDSLGDTLPFGNDVYDASNSNLIGRDEGICFRTNPGLAWECTFTIILDDGTLTVQGPFYDDLRDSQLAITGGTGRWWNARGEMTLHSRNAGGTEFDFIFRITG